MRVPEFIKEVVWAVYPPRYRQLADKPFLHSLGFMSKILLFAFIIAGILFVPKLFLLKDNIESELSKFSSFSLSGNITQSDKIAIPHTNPWVVVDLNSNLTLTKEIFVVDKDNIRYRFFGIKSIPREQIMDLTAHKAPASRFLSAVIVMMLPGIALLLYIRMWLKYLLFTLVFGTLFFIIMELSKFRLSWKQMLNVAAHSLTVIIFLEVISASLTTVYLLPRFRFLGVNVYIVTTILFAVLMVVGIAGYHIANHRGHR